MKGSVFAMLLFSFLASVGQDGIEWSPTRKLSVNDFKGPAPDPTSKQSLSLAFGSEVNLKVEDVKNLKTFNDRVLNLFIAEKSWIDWRDESRLRYAITLFDLNEWMIREMRKRFNENRKLVLAGEHEPIAEEVRKDFSRIRQEYDNESSYGNDPAGQLRWETRISERLVALGEFCKACKP